MAFLIKGKDNLEEYSLIESRLMISMNNWRI
jgi:hypothetical protein